MIVIIFARAYFRWKREEHSSWHLRLQNPIQSRFFSFKIKSNKKTTWLITKRHAVPGTCYRVAVVYIVYIYILLVTLKLNKKSSMILLLCAVSAQLSLTSKGRSSFPSLFLHFSVVSLSFCSTVNFLSEHGKHCRRQIYWQKLGIVRRYKGRFFFAYIECKRKKISVNPKLGAG